MEYAIRKTELSDVEHLPLVERSAGSAFKSLPSLAAKPPTKKAAHEAAFNNSTDRGRTAAYGFVMDV